MLTCAAPLRALTFFFHVIVLLLVEVADALCTAARILPLGPIDSGRCADRTIVLNEIVGLLAVARGAGFELALIHLLVHIRLVMDLCGACGQSEERRAAGAAQRCRDPAAPNGGAGTCLVLLGAEPSALAQRAQLGRRRLLLLRQAPAAAGGAARHRRYS